MKKKFVWVMEKLKNLELLKVQKVKNGRVMAPLLMWMLGVPGGLVILIWLFFFRGT